MHEVAFVSQLENVQPQNGCGIASLMMLLKFHCDDRRVPSYEQLANGLRADKLPSEKSYTWYRDKWGKGAYVDDVCLWLLQNGLAFKAISQKSRSNERLLFRFLSDGPVMVGMEWHGGHWVVLVDSNSEHITMLDPLRRSDERYLRRISRSRFFSAWDGPAISILGISS